MYRPCILILLCMALMMASEGLSQEFQVSCSIYPTSLDFGTLNIGLSKDIYFTLTNTGDEILSGVVSESCEDFSIISGGGSYSLGEGQSRIVTVRFAPTSIGSKSCTIETGHSSCSDVTCSGTGDTSPSCSVYPTSLDFGRLDEGGWDERSFTITNVGGGTLNGSVSASCEDFSIVSGGGSYSLGGGQFKTVTVRFAPTSTGNKSCTVETGNSSCADVNCSGTSGVLPACSLSTTSLDFGTINIGISVDLDFTITNTGGGTVSGSVSESCEDYSIVSGEGSYSLGADQSWMVTVRFAPTSTGSIGCTIETGDDLCTDVTCFGAGDIPPTCSLSTESLDFGTVDVGNWEDRSFTIMNTGGGTLSGRMSEFCEDFNIVSGSGSYSLEAGQSWTVTVRFAPASSGSKSCTIETGNSLCADVNCTGMGDIPPSCSITPVNVDFWTVLLGNSMDLDFTITNVGGRTLSGTVSESCEEYSIVFGGGSYSLGADESWTVTVRFTPTSIGSTTCTIETGNSLCTDVVCSGWGDILPSCSIDPTSLSFGRVDIGNWEEQSFTITNTGGGTLSGSVSESCSHFSVISGGGSYSLGADESRTVTVRFEPTSMGSKSCTIETGDSVCTDVSCIGTGGDLPLCSVYPTDLDFGTVTVGLSAELSFTIANSGGGKLSGSVIESCEDYSIVSGGGSYSLGAGQARIVTVQFAPTSIGSKSCTIETGNSSCSDVDCSGAGFIPSPCTVYPTSLDFGIVLIGDAEDRSFTITNTGGGTLSGVVSELCQEYSIVSGGGSYSLEGGESRTVTVRFEPISMGGKDCTIETGTGLCSDVYCTGAGDTDPSCSVEPMSLDFGTVIIGESSDLSFTITNTGGGTLSGTVSESCGEYSIVSGAGSYSLGAGGFRTVMLRFTPASTGNTTCTIETGAGLCSDVDCSGTGEALPSCSIDPTSLDFGTVLIGDAEDGSFTITNTGGGTLSGSVSETCEEYSIVSGSGSYSLGADESWTVTVRFEPASMGSKTCTIETGVDACDDVDCSGIGDELPSCSVEPTSLDFGTVIVGESADLDFTITNTGGGTLSGSVSESCEEYSILSGGGSYSLGAGQTWTVTVRFAPASMGSKTCTIETGIDLCDDVSCSGMGEALPSCSVDPTSLDFGTVIVGESADLDFTITNTGGGTLSGSVSESCEEYSIVSGDGAYSLGAGQTWTVTVRFAPASMGSKTCTIETGVDVCDDVSCSGMGEALPSCSVDPTSLDFGTVDVGESTELSFTITNTGGGTLSGSVSESCEGYSIVSGSGSYSLGAGQTWTVTVQFAPESTGTIDCTIEVGNDECSDVSCTGVGYKHPTSVSQIGFSAMPEKCCVSLRWRADRASDFVEFMVYRSIDNTMFEKIGTRELREGMTWLSCLDCGLTKKGEVYYKLDGVSVSGQVEEIGRASIEMTRIASEGLMDLKNCPNPFNATTEIQYFLTEPAHVILSIYNTLGQEIDVLVHQYESAGDHSVSWNARGVPSGVYVYRIQAGTAVMARKMLLLR